LLTAPRSTFPAAFSTFLTVTVTAITHDLAPSPLSDKELQQFYTSGVPAKFVVRDMSLLQPPTVG
jgi:hypothetical protein